MAPPLLEIVRVFLVIFRMRKISSALWGRFQREFSAFWGREIGILGAHNPICSCIRSSSRHRPVCGNLEIPENMNRAAFGKGKAGGQPDVVSRAREYSASVRKSVQELAIRFSASARIVVQISSTGLQLLGRSPR